MEQDLSVQLKEQVSAAYEQQTPLRIVGSDSKAFYGGELIGDPLPVSEHKGIVSYEPSELVITVRCGTQLQEVEKTLASRGQMLAFEPPYYGENATIGGTIACGFSGPRRPDTPP